jgi:hypothetical protein
MIKIDKINIPYQQKMSKQLTVGDLIEALKEMDPKLPITYSHDDEGNEYQFVSYLPSVMKVKTTPHGRVEIVDKNDCGKDILEVVNIN